MLKTVHCSFDDRRVSDDINEFVDELESRVDHFLEGKPFAQNGFVACNHRVIAQALQHIQDQGLAAGNLLLEWGSGYGGVASIASMLGFESYGIEINREVLRLSERLAGDFELNVEFIEGSFIPEGSDDLVDQAFLDNDGDLTLECYAEDAYGDLGLSIDDFDVIFVFPWPNEAKLLGDIFDRFGASGSLLLTYNDFSGLDRKSVV